MNNSTTNNIYYRQKNAENMDTKYYGFRKSIMMIKVNKIESIISGQFIEWPDSNMNPLKVVVSASTT